MLKRILIPCDFCAADCNHIIAHGGKVSHMMHHSIIVCHFTDLSLLAIVYCLRRMSGYTVFAVFYLDKDSVVSIFSNDINLAPAVSVIALKDCNSLFLQIFSGSLLIFCAFFPSIHYQTLVNPALSLLQPNPMVSGCPDKRSPLP